MGLGRQTESVITSARKLWHLDAHKGFVTLVDLSPLVNNGLGEAMSGLEGLWRGHVVVVVRVRLDDAREERR